MVSSLRVAHERPDRSLPVFFFSNEGPEPPHVHVQRDRQLAKFWLSPVALVGSTGFAAPELTRIQAMVEENRQAFLEAWHEYFGG